MPKVFITLISIIKFIVIFTVDETGNLNAAEILSKTSFGSFGTSTSCPRRIYSRRYEFDQNSDAGTTAVDTVF